MTATPGGALGARMHQFVQSLQDEICGALERLEPKARFREDIWTREGGGGGRSRVLEDGEVLEKGGVNVSAVHGELTEAFARKLNAQGRTFFATGVSLVLHPRNPLAPTAHANFRYLVYGEGAQEAGGFGGGADLTPHYLFEEDAAHFHRTLKAACDRHHPEHYPRFKDECDRYFYLPHRGETRGVGGLFFEHLRGDPEATFAFVQDCGRAFVPAYVPLLERRAAMPHTPEQRAWQEIRRGRYAEFNLLYDRGTVFGLETGGRTESILMSLPPRVRWVYDHHPEPGTPEQALVDVLRRPRTWV